MGAAAPLAGGRRRGMDGAARRTERRGPRAPASPRTAAAPLLPLLPPPLLRGGKHADGAPVFSACRPLSERREGVRPGFVSSQRTLQHVPPALRMAQQGARAEPRRRSGRRLPARRDRRRRRRASCTSATTSRRAWRARAPRPPRVPPREAGGGGRARCRRRRATSRTARLRASPPPPPPPPRSQAHGGVVALCRGGRRGRGVRGTKIHRVGPGFGCRAVTTGGACARRGERKGGPPSTHPRAADLPRH